MTSQVLRFRSYELNLENNQFFKDRKGFKKTRITKKLTPLPSQCRTYAETTTIRHSMGQMGNSRNFLKTTSDKAFFCEFYEL